MEEIKKKKLNVDHELLSEGLHADDLDAAWSAHPGIWIPTKDDQKIGQLVLDIMPDAVLFLDARLRILWANQKALKENRMTRHELYGHSCHHALRGSTRPCPGCPAIEVLQTGKPSQTEIEDQDHRIWSKRAFPVLDQQGSVSGMVEFSNEITDQVKNRHRLKEEQFQEAQVQKLESLGTMASAVAQSFNQMIMSILGNVSLALLGLPLKSPLRGYLEKIEKNSQLAVETIKYMLAYSGQGRNVVQQVDLTRLLEKMTAGIRASIPERVVFNYHLQRALPMIEADASQMRQVVTSLVNNALEAMQDREGTLCIRTGSMQVNRTDPSMWIMGRNMPEGACVYLEVSDTGCGIDEVTQAKMFDPFFTTKQKARGLGLSAVLGIARGLQGAIKVSSKPGQGSAFRVVIGVKEDCERTTSTRAGPGPSCGV